MSRFCISSHPITGRSWRSGHPFRPRTGRLRRAIIFLLLLFFTLVIFGYNYVTDSKRVREMAEAYLSDLIGGRVTVNSATLSIFEGLHVEDVKIYVDDGSQPDSLIFSAQSFSLKYDPAKIIGGQLEAAEIIAQKPHVYLTENVATHEWNFYRLGKNRSPSVQPAPSGPMINPPMLPEVLVRNARVEISEVRDGKRRVVGSEGMDGHVSPSVERGSFNFEIQTRGAAGVGPWATGSVALATNKVDIQIYKFDLNRDVTSIVPEDVAAFLHRHGMSGLIPLLSVHYQPGKTPDKPNFAIEMHLDNVNFSAQEEDYLSAADVSRRATVRQAVAMLQPFYRIGGYGVGLAGGNGQIEQDAQSLRPRTADRAARNPNVQLTLLSAEPAQSSAATDFASAVSHASSPTFSVSHSPPAISSPADMVVAMTVIAPIELHEGSGVFAFTDSGLELKNVVGTVEGNSFAIDGQMFGYRPDAPFRIHVHSLENHPLQIPGEPRYLNSMPPMVREIWSIIHPDGHCTMDTTINRPSPGARPLFNGQVDILDGTFACSYFPYPLNQAHGRVQFGYDEKEKADFVHVLNIRARGLADGPNRDSYVVIDGDVGPLGPEIPDPQVVIHVTAENISSEPVLMRSLPPQVREPLKIFDADKTGKYPAFHGNFHTTVLHKAGWAWKWTFDTDVSLDETSGKLRGFPYFIDHMAVEAHVRDGYVDVVNAHMKKGDATMRVDGRVTWGAARPPDAPPVPDKVTTDMHVVVKNLPMDRELLAALPPAESAWIKRVGLGGKLDVDGRVFQGFSDPSRPGAPIDPDDVSLDLVIGLHNGTLWPADGTFSISDLSSTAHLTHDALELKEFSGKRAGADVRGEGAIYWGRGPVQLAMHIKSKSLPMDAPLYELLPKSGRETWDEIQPSGNVEADLNWRGSFTKEDMPVVDRNGNGSTTAATQPARAVAFATNAPGAAHMAQSATATADMRPSTAAPQNIAANLPSIFSRIEPGLHAVLKPHGMTCTIKEIPFRLDGIEGTINVTPEKVTLTDVTAHHGAAAFAVSGSGNVGDQSAWDLKLSGKNLAVNQEFRQAMPPALLSMLDAIQFSGDVDFDFPRFIYRSKETAPDASPAANATRAPSAARSSTTPRPTTVDLDMDSAIALKGCSVDAGAAMKNVFGKLTLSAAVRDGKLSALAGNINLPKATVAGREMTDVSFIMTKPADRQELYLQKVHGVLAQGQVAGEARLSYPDDGPSRYLLSLVVRNADLKTLVGDADKNLKGELTASLSMEGNWGDGGARHGRGDVIVTGKELYHLPLMLGLFQVTNLALPIATPFKTGTARYSIEGPRINFERIDLKSDNMLMEGTGHLDFKTKQVLMTFTTDNPNGLKVPFLNDLIKNAKGELLKITIKGTIKEPKVEANPFGTITTTIDEVFKADGKK